ncbi:MAG: tetratricopeptide repeat protein [Acidobacteriota bacterium]
MKKSTNYNLGSYLRKLRAQRRLSLTKVEELSLSFKDPIKPSYLSKIETGKFVPALPKLVTLSKIYGVKIQSLIERLDLEEDAAPVDLTGITYEELKQKGLEELRHGNFKKALSFFEASLDLSMLSRKEKTAESELSIAVMLRNMGKLELAKLKIEEILLKYYQNKDITARAYLEYSYIFRSLGHFPLSLSTIKEAENLSNILDNPELNAYIFHLKANIHSELNEVEDAIKEYEKAEKIFVQLNNSLEICRTISNKAIALAKKKSYDAAIKLLEESLAMAYKYDFKKLVAIILSNLGYCYYLKNKRKEAIRYFVRSNNISRKGDYYNILFTNCFYLMKINEKMNASDSVEQYKKVLRSFLPKIEGTFSALEEFKSLLELEGLKDK